MGNGMSEEEEKQFMEEAYKMSLDNPDVDKKINSGTTAPNCQPKHTQLEDDSSEGEEDDDVDHTKEEHGHEIVASPGGNVHIHETKARRPSRRKVRPKKKVEQAEFVEDPHEQERKLSYLQMARIGYQELVNAIIRPPRADYKVRRIHMFLVMIYRTVFPEVCVCVIMLVPLFILFLYCL